MQLERVELPDSLWLQYQFRDYRNPKARIQRLHERGMLIRLKRGVYLSDWAKRDPYRLGRAANRLYGPSYVSFEYALRWHGLIPEHVEEMTSATFRKNRSKRFDTNAGRFSYYDIPPQAYPRSVVFEPRGGNASHAGSWFLLAAPEKALCDQLYRISGVRSQSAIEQLLFDDLRIDPAVYATLEQGLLARLCRLYRTETLSAFARYVERRYCA